MQRLRDLVVGMVKCLPFCGGGGDSGGDPIFDSKTAIALQLYLDRIPISSLPGINNSSSSVLSLHGNDRVGDAIRVLYEKDVYCAPIVNPWSHDVDVNRYNGLIDVDRMLLWSLQEYEKTASWETDCGDYFSMLEQNPRISNTTLLGLVKYFVWDSFRPVNVDDPVLRAFMTFSGNGLGVVPVTDKPGVEVIGFVTENAVMEILLQSDGVEWFNDIADKPLSEFSYLCDRDPTYTLYEDESVVDAICMLWEETIDAIAVVQRETRKLTGCVRRSDLRLFMGNNYLFRKRRTLTVGDFVRMDDRNEEMTDPDTDRDYKLTLRNGFGARMDSPVTNKTTDTIRQVIKGLMASKCSFSFLVDDLKQVKAVLTLYDMHIRFSSYVPMYKYRHWW